jgi:predicted secreted protein
MLRPSLALVAVSLIFACEGCHHEAPAPTPGSGGAVSPDGGDASSTPETVVRVEDDGKTLEVSPGTRVVFKLASNSGTGYAWTPASVDAAVLALQGEREVERQSDVPGGAKLDVLRFLAKAPGTVVVQVDLKRPFGDQPVARTVKVTVTVR